MELFRFKAYGIAPLNVFFHLSAAPQKRKSLNHCKLGHKPLHIKKVVVGQLLLLQDEERLQLLQEQQLIPLACIFSPETKQQGGPEPSLFLYIGEGLVCKMLFFIDQYTKY